MRALDGLATAAAGTDERLGVVVNPGEVGGDSETGHRDDGEAGPEGAVAHAVSARSSAVWKAARPGLPAPRRWRLPSGVVNTKVGVPLT